MENYEVTIQLIEPRDDNTRETVVLTMSGVRADSWDTANCFAEALADGMTKRAAHNGTIEDDDFYSGTAEEVPSDGK